MPRGEINDPLRVRTDDRAPDLQLESGVYTSDDVVGGNTMNHDQWKEDMHDGVDLAHKNTWVRRPVTVTEATQLHKSINASINPDLMKDDTLFRTRGVVGVNKAERINGIAESLHALNYGRDGG